ncbi:MAG: serine hydrolase [Betaproteobacteria bacterium]|nr:serine hydrolase [Betaproteobacteria bacterium]
MKPVSNVFGRRDQVMSFLLALISLVAASSAVAQGWRERADALAQAAVREGRSRGLVIAWVSPEGSGWVSAGASGNAARPQIDDQTLFEIGSITKTFTASLLATAVERGEAKREDTLGTLLPDLAFGSPQLAQVQLQELATHRSGLPALPLTPEGAKRILFHFDNPYRGTPVEDFWELLGDSSLLNNAESNKQTQLYSNFAVAVLGQSLARKLGTDYDKLIEERILQPLEMRTTQVHAPLAREHLMAQGHKPNFRSTSRWDLDAYAPAGGIWSNAQDLSRYLAAQIDQSAPGAKLAQAIQVAPPQTRYTMGLGWFVDAHMGRQAWWHNGGTGGFRSFLGFEPARRSGVLILSNTAQGVDDLGWHLLLDKPVASAAPALAAHLSTWMFTLLAPLFLWSARRRLLAPPTARAPESAPSRLAQLTRKFTQASDANLDRLGVLTVFVAALFLLSLARSFGAWQSWPMAIWWTSLALSLILGLLLGAAAARLPWVTRRSVWQWLGWGAGLFVMLAGGGVVWLFG